VSRARACLHVWSVCMSGLFACLVCRTSLVHVNLFKYVFMCINMCWGGLGVGDALSECGFVGVWACGLPYTNKYTHTHTRARALSLFLSLSLSLSLSLFPIHTLSETVHGSGCAFRKR
jgi:hypothetical protein